MNYLPNGYLPLTSVCLYFVKNHWKRRRRNTFSRIVDFTVHKQFIRPESILQMWTSIALLPRKSDFAQCIYSLTWSNGHLRITVTSVQRPTQIPPLRFPLYVLYKMALGTTVTCWPRPAATNFHPKVDFCLWTTATQRPGNLIFCSTTEAKLIHFVKITGSPDNDYKKIHFVTWCVYNFNK